MTKDNKHIIASSIGLGFFITMLLLYGLDVLLAPLYTIDPGLADPWIPGICGPGGIIICILGIRRHTKTRKQ